MSVNLNIIVAACENAGIGKNGELPWRLRITQPNCMIRRSISLPVECYPHHPNIVLQKFDKKELAYFARMTKDTQDDNKKNAVIMGRRTWESIPGNHKPLTGRMNIVLSRSIKDLGAGVTVCDSLDAALKHINREPQCDVVETAWVIGGSSVYKEALASPDCARVYITRIKEDIECDTFLPQIPKEFVSVIDSRVPIGMQEENGIKYEYQVLSREKKTTPRSD